MGVGLCSSPLPLPLFPSDSLTDPLSNHEKQTLTDSVNSPFSTLDALSLATTSLEALLHVEVDGKRDWVAVRGGKSLLDVEGKVVAVSTGTEVLLF